MSGIQRQPYIRLLGGLFPIHIGIAAASLFALGCAKGPENPTTFPVTGTVTYKGKPVEGANVSFVGDGTARPAYGLTDAQGKFRLSTFGDGDGAIPGKHRVSVTKMNSAGGPIDDGSMEAAEKRANQPRAAPQSALPERYNDWNRSQLEFTVAETDKNDFTIELKD